MFSSLNAVFGVAIWTLRRKRLVVGGDAMGINSSIIGFPETN